MTVQTMPPDGAATRFVPRHRVSGENSARIGRAPSDPGTAQDRPGPATREAAI
ncbi:hypothetical protein OG233_13800 [Streptomyces sp. NBC_01218]|uniref:hypothetical protein n=1 Tax=unclassified Streptomyces TaxID=2593676 RepID=UPI0023B8CCF2|nr:MULTISPECIES: hypothetical protein [unclassified Streptomyces]WEH40471.1 hypothetical protein PZB77_13650 [Streptomyces sp. AM 2-1-1]WSQ52163.1 hypothetical protein OG233_13800 [Streptomyces sp. NBC_01218]